GGADGRIVTRRRFNVDAARGGAGIREQISSALKELLPAAKPAAIGAGFGGPVDVKTGRICCSHQVEGWSEFALGEWLASLSGLPVVVENDANTAALGEAHCGAGRGANPVFYITLGSGVGGGLVVDGHVYHGAKPGEAEIGHVRLDRSGVIVEQRCSGWAVDRKVRELVKREPASLLAQLAAGATSGEAKFLAPAIAQGDAVAKQILRETAEELAFALSHAAHLFHPEVIVIGGGLSLLGEPLRAAVAVALRGFVMDVFAPGPRVLLAGLGEDAVPVGALLLAGEILSRKS
ncbi:MAG: ROK family protein, partial [Verrucomicrobia bacterium]|nr:ROK family protein [Verrucomicrobiota bacterium]